MQQIKTLLVPKYSELITYSTVALVLLILNNISKIWLFLGGTNLDQLKYSELVNSDLQNFIFKFDNEILPKFADFLIWAFLGLLIFLIISLVKAFIDSTKEHVAFTDYINRPKDLSIQAYITKLFIRITSFIVMIFWFYIFVFKLFPELAKIFFTSAFNFNLVGLIWIIITVAICAVSLYIFAILLRFMMLKTRVFN